MVKKSPRDLYKDDLSRRAKRKRQGLKGPFRCPKCLFAEKLHCQTKTKVVKEDYIKETGEEGVRWRRRTIHLFSCRECKYHKIVVSPGDPAVIDEYNALYDGELSLVEAEVQRGYTHDYSIKILKLLECKVSMK